MISATDVSRLSITTSAISSRKVHHNQSSSRKVHERAESSSRKVHGSIVTYGDHQFFKGVNMFSEKRQFRLGDMVSQRKGQQGQPSKNRRRARPTTHLPKLITKHQPPKKQKENSKAHQPGHPQKGRATPLHYPKTKRQQGPTTPARKGQQGPTFPKRKQEGPNHHPQKRRRATRTPMVSYQT